jgi:hypothetical protein
MTDRAVTCRPLLGGLLLLAAGCFADDKPPLVAPSPFGPTAQVPGATRLVNAPAPEPTQEVALRVAAVGKKVQDANPQIAMSVTFTTVGAPHPEAFHRALGANFQGCQVIVSEGIVRQCRTDGQLAAVLALELGKAVSEREAQVPASARMAEPGLPIDVPVGNDVRGPFGASDMTRLAELAKRDRQRPRPEAPPPPPVPEVLARGYLSRAGFAASDLTDVLPLLRQAEDHGALERQFKAAPGG